MSKLSEILTKEDIDFLKWVVKLFNAQWCEVGNTRYIIPKPAAVKERENGE